MRPSSWRIEQALCRSEDIPRFACNAKCRIGEERDLSVRVRNAGKKVGHRDETLAHPGRYFAIIQMLNKDDFEIVLQHAGVIHGAALVMSAVLQNLIVQALPKELLSNFAPPGAGLAAEKDSCEEQGLGIRKKVIPLQVKLEMIFKIACLLVEARQPR